MQKIYHEVGSLDKRCYEQFFLNEDLLMEHAAEGIATFIRENFSKNSSVLIVTGSGNNGADGLALARLLYKEYAISLYYAKEPKSPMAQLQQKRNTSLGITPTTQLKKSYDVVVDAIVGTGFRGEFDEKLGNLLQTLNQLQAYKIACDTPSGLSADGIVASHTFYADTTLTMGALKLSMFSDSAKAFVGKIEVLNLGISRELYEVPSTINLLEFSDMQLPSRKNPNTHKGSFGHLCVAMGEKSGAALISALSALRFGAGLVSLVALQKSTTTIPHTLMLRDDIAPNATALACGMGLGDVTKTQLESLFAHNVGVILDADILHSSAMVQLLKRNNTIITPHPKEFVSLLKTLDLADITIEQLQEKRFEYAQLFTHHYPDVVLLLKGANVIISYQDMLYINPHGSSKLAKGGSGDILSGLIASLLAQGYTPLQAAISGSLAHTKVAQNYTGADFSLTPDDLIEGIGNL